MVTIFITKKEYLCYLLQYRKITKYDNYLLLGYRTKVLLLKLL